MKIHVELPERMKMVHASFVEIEALTLAKVRAKIFEQLPVLMTRYNCTSPDQIVLKNKYGAEITDEIALTASIVESACFSIVFKKD